MTCTAGAPASETATGAGTVRTLQGWDNPHPISIAIRPDQLAGLRGGIRRDLAALLPRCEALERGLPEEMRHNRHYAASKRHRDFPLTLGHAEMLAAAGSAVLLDPPARLRLSAVDSVPGSLPAMLRRTGAMLAVGDVLNPDLDGLLTRCRAPRLASGDGVPAGTPGGGTRPAANAFSTWMAHADEARRATVGAIVLGCMAGRADVELLRRRLHGHQRVLVEAGSGALTWLLASWDGAVVRDGGVFVFSEPGSTFREPSARAGFAPSGTAAVPWPRISVVTVSYNQQQYLEQCLRSVLDQRYPNLEFIVIDAGSTDGSIDILRRHAAEFTHLVIEPDAGQSDGLNKGFRRATGDILTWVNSDDMLAPSALKRAALAFAGSGADMVAGTCVRVAGVDAQLLHRSHPALPTGRRVPFDLAGPLDWCTGWEKGDYFFQPEVFFTRALWDRAGGYLKPHLYWAMDWDLWLRCALAGATIVRIPDVLGVSRAHEAQKTTSDEMYLWQIASTLREFDDLLALLERDGMAA